MSDKLPPNWPWPHCYAFGGPVGPVHEWYAWRPVRTYYGKWVWLKKVSRVRIVKYTFLDGPDWQFWSYGDLAAANDSATP